MSLNYFGEMKMILQMLPKRIQLLYIKLQTSLSYRGFLEALRELFEELEWNDDTKDVYDYFSKRLHHQEQQDNKQNEESNKWLKAQFKTIQGGRWENESLKAEVLPQLSVQLKQIQDGHAEIANFLYAKVDLLRKIAITLSHYGEFEILKNIGITKTISISPPFGLDPLKELVKSKKTIFPFSEDGKILIGTLGKGFIKADVFPPIKECKTNRYFIDQGFIIFQWPDSIKRIIAMFHSDWRAMLDISAARCLHTLLCYAAWRDWMTEEWKLSGSPSDKELIIFYNRLAMKQHIAELLSDNDFEKTRKEVFKILDRFLVVLMHELVETKGQRGNKNRAEKYAYMCVKALLFSKSLEERKEFTRDKVADMILERVQEEDLTFNVTRTNCLAACTLFENKHGWPKKRGPDTKKRMKKVG